MAFGRLNKIRSLHGTLRSPDYSSLLGSSRSSWNLTENGLKYWRLPSSGCDSPNVLSQRDTDLEFYSRRLFSCSCKSIPGVAWSPGNKREITPIMDVKSYIMMGGTRSFSTPVKAPPQARQMGSFKVSQTSPGIIYEPYAPREPIAFWRRCFTRSGWRRTKDDIILELKSAYAINKLRKSGYSKKKFYNEAVEMYKQINTLIATGDKTLLRKTVTDKLYSGLKNEIKVRESMWSSVYWELVEPIIKLRTLRARLIGVDRNDTNKVFIQLTMEFLAKQKFEAYDSEGKVVAGDKNKEVLVRDIWVFEKSLFLPGSYWRLCGRINLSDRG